MQERRDPWVGSQQVRSPSTGPLAEFTPLTRYEPKLLDDFHYSETTEIIFWDESSDDAVPSYLFNAELDDETIGRALSSPLFIQGAWRTSEPETSVSLLRRKFVASSVLFCVSLQNGETRART